MAIAIKPYLRSVSFKADRTPSFDVYPYVIPAIRHLGVLEFHPDVTFFVGENGAGKSTLLEGIALALGYSPEGGTRNVRFATTNSTSELHRDLQLVKGHAHPTDGYFFRAESFFNVATYMENIGLPHAYGDVSLHAQSHGEAFMAAIADKFRGNGLYLMDEPEAALSPQRQLAMLIAMDGLVKKRSQFIIATHSPILLAYPNAKIVRFDESGLSPIAYEETEHYAITRDFLNNYPKRLEQLFAEDETES